MKLGLRPLRVSPYSVNWLTTKSSAPISRAERLNLFLIVGKYTQVDCLADYVAGVFVAIVLGDAEQDDQPWPYATYDLTGNRDRSL